ncbi:MAG: T9SS type A sorting domain-containing protein [Planctomycetes bacterium]|nr:T9SS type A sorting domain-containing protein [Planctomycetota bacterium]
MKIFEKIKFFFRENEHFSLIYEKLKWKKFESKSNLSDTDFAIWFYKKITGKDLNLVTPETFDEKLWYLKIYNKDPLLTKCTDKFLVREYVKECGLENILMYDARGALVIHQQNVLNGASTSINVGDLSAGLYELKVSSHDGQIWKKTIIVR